MNRLIFITLLFFYGVQPNLIAQNYTFDDGILPANWLGQNTYFEIDNLNQLHLNAPAGTSLANLKWPAPQTVNVIWEFYFKYTFSASTTNYANFYLYSAEEDAASATNQAYFLKLGGAAGTIDKIELIYQNGSSKTTVLESRAGIVGASTVSMRVRVSKMATGNWELFVDDKGGNNFTKEATGLHSSSTRFAYTGIQCRYSSTRKDKMYFDDIHVYEPFSLTNYSIINENKITLTFSKNIQSEINFSINLPVGQIYTTNVYANQVEINVAGNIHPNTYNIELNGLHSIDGDTLWNSAIQIIKKSTYYVGQLRFTEWMSDPSPSYGLPELEWVEFLNTSEYAIDLSAFTLSDPSTKTSLPAYQLQSNEVVVVCASGGCKQLGAANCAEVASMPSLNNSADSLFLRAKDSLLVDYIHYELTALPTDYRQDGGYSIVREILPNACFFTQRINFSSEQIGGSPGVMSIPLTSTSEPIQIISSIFSESQITLDVPIVCSFQTRNFEPSNVVASIQSSYSEISTHVTLFLNAPMEEGTSMELYIDSIQTCLHQSVYFGEKIEIIYPKSIQKGDVFINEILYNANTGGVDFVELFNTTDKYIQLKNTHYANEDPVKATQHVIIAENCIIKPISYIVLSADIAKIKQQYANAVTQNCFEKIGFLSFSDDGGELFFLNDKSDTLDRIQYGDQFQNPLNRDNEGLSLEKIKSNEGLFYSSNWTSSATKATPGFLNSQAISAEVVSTKIFYCNPCHITTNANGHNDYVHLHLNPHVKGAFASVSIYTISGELVDKVCVNQLLGTLNTFNWFGQHQSNAALPDGIYIAVAEWWSPEGETHTEKIAISTSQY